ncbi:hypothetical protein D3C76_570040 [compost metagenome]
MREWNELILDQLVWIVGGLIIVSLWLLVWNITQGSKLRKMRKKYQMMMKDTGIEDLESLLIDLKMQQEKIEVVQEDQKMQLAKLNHLVPKKKAKIGITRYNAFGERGNDLSFSIAFINDEKDGVVLTGLYNRDGSYVYAKPLTKGESSHVLSPEERQAIDLAGQEE